MENHLPESNAQHCGPGKGDVEENGLATTSNDLCTVLGRVSSATAGRDVCQGLESLDVHPPGEIYNRGKRSGIILLMILGNLIQYTSMFSTVAGGYEFSAQLGRGVGPGQANWMAAAYSLTQSAFVLVSGRLGAIYGHQRLFLIGGAFIAVFSLVNAFCTSYNAFVAVRALTGIGGGLIMPNAVATLTIMVPRGRSRNITLALFASSPPIGASIGALLSGALLQYAEWKWLFILFACVATAIYGALFIILPPEVPIDKQGSIDYIGAALGLSSLVLFNFAWNQAPSQGWRVVYIPTLVGLSVALFGAFVFWESRYAAAPIMPLSIFTAPTFAALIFVVLLTYMSVGIALWYMVAWQQLLRDWTVLELAVGWIPYSIGASMAVGVAAWLIPRLPAQWILAGGVVAQVASCLVLATMPEKQIYWAQIFPAIVLGSVCPDFVYVAAQVITSNSVGKRNQGVAGSLVGTLNLYGNSLGLGFAGTIETQLIDDGRAQVDGYRMALYFGAALGLAALLLDIVAVRVQKDKRESGIEDEEN